MDVRLGNHLNTHGVHTSMGFWIKIAVLMSSLGIAATQASACKCGGVHARTAWETAQEEARRSDAIFEATPERFNVQWNILTAKSGDLIHADAGGSEDLTNNYPRMLITFRVKRVYKGNVGASVQVWTGMGGGDCGAAFPTGLDYLVYASGSGPKGLALSMCSPGGWLGSNYLSTELRYLRNERPISTDFAPLEYGTPSAVARLDRERNEFIKRYATATGQICGVLSGAPIGNDERKTIMFLPTIGYSPYEAPETEVDRTGKFCSGQLGPGQYYLYFTRGPWQGELQSALYYPGVAERAKATIFRVESGQVQSDVVFQVPAQRAYTVRGLISTDDKTGISEEGVSVILVSPDGRIRHRQSVDFRTLFPLPRSKYFSFGNVLPGRYIACAYVSGRGWVTRVVEVNVTTYSAFVSLAIKHANGGRD